MHRRLSQAFRSTSGAGPSSSSSTLEKIVDDDDESKVSTICRDEPAIRLEPSYKVKRVDYYYSRWHKYYKYRVRSPPLSLTLSHFFLEHQRQDSGGGPPSHSERNK